MRKSLKKQGFSPLWGDTLWWYPKVNMHKELRSLDFSKLDLAPEIRQMLGQLLNHIELLATELAELRAENQRLRDEIARLKGGPGQPDMKANRTNTDNAAAAADDEEKEHKKPPQRGASVSQKNKNRKPRNERITIDREEIVTLDRSALPADVKVHSYRKVVIQDIKFETDNVLYRLEKLYAESTGRYYEADLPIRRTKQLYGSGLEAFVLLLYFQLRVTENKIWKLLHSIGVVISAGQISNIIIQKHLAKFSEERAAIVRVGLKTSQHHHIDDTGARENGINQHTFALGNPYYSSFFTKRYKNQATVKKLLNFLDEPPGSPETSKELTNFIKILIADDAPQFHDITPYRGLCWWHEVRLFEKLHPIFDYHQNLLADFIGKLWDYYARLVAYKNTPSEKFKAELSAEFDKLLATVTGYEELDQRIKLTRQKKPHLLLVLAFPEIPLDNNLAERSLREIVIKRKISNGTRVKAGTKAWDVFLSILGTCRKNNVNFYEYLRDRISLANELPSLATVLLARSQISA